MTVAIVDYGMGNLFNVLRACDAVGLPARISSDPDEVERASAIILPGVGAFGDAMTELRGRGLDEAIGRSVAAGRPFFGVCLGLQLMMETSSEFGAHTGLGLVAGDVVRFDAPRHDGETLKVPQVGWNAVRRPTNRSAGWAGTPLEAIIDGTPMYFVHSFYVRPAEPEVIVATTRYGDTEFCSSIARANLFGSQFHPERSGPAGLQMYRTFAKALRR